MSTTAKLIKEMKDAMKDLLGENYCSALLSHAGMTMVMHYELIAKQHALQSYAVYSQTNEVW